MPFKLTTLPHWSAHPASFTKRFTCKPGTDEREQVVKSVKRAKENQCRIHVLSDKHECYGFTAISITTIGKYKIPVLILEYLFVSLQYRGQDFDLLDGLKVADWLIAETLQLADQITASVPLRYVGLEPATDRLSVLYQQHGFHKIDSTQWLYAAVPKPK